MLKTGSVPHRAFVEINEKILGKNLAPYRIGKHSNPQNRAKIRQKH